MNRILIFGGTTEGRLLAEFCDKNGINAFVSVATGYGESLLHKSDCINIISGRKNAEEILSFILKKKIAMVVDATHPFAIEASKNIKEACGKAKVKYLRVLRDSEKNACNSGNCYGIYFDSVYSVIEYLNKHTDGNILITTGSKELDLYCAITNYSERCIVRVLPSEGIEERCVSLGYRCENIIAGKGPFSDSQNIRHIRQYSAAYLVTKDSGATGGFDEKIAAAQTCGTELLIIRRPAEIGVSLEEAEKIIVAENNDEQIRKEN